MWSLEVISLGSFQKLSKFRHKDLLELHNPNRLKMGFAFVAQRIFLQKKKKTPKNKQTDKQKIHTHTKNL